jgi:hypothetical protein
LSRQQKNRATSLIEEFMVAANGVVARTFEDAGVASIRRIVRTPKRWDRIVEVAEGLGTTLPAEPDSKALNDFLLAQKQKDPDHFPDLSLAVIKLMGPGEYVLVKPNEPSPGHFGLAVQDYTHSTAPNRRFPDVVTQRLLKAFLAKAPQPYSEDDLNAIAVRCTLMEDGARKVEREMQKRIAAVVLHPRIGQSFPAIVTGVNKYGTFVRTLDPHVDGMLVQGGKGLDVGDKVTVKLVSTDPQRGFIDFAAFNTTQNQNAAPLSPGQKYELFFKSATDPWPFGLAAVVAGIGQADGSPQAWGGGTEGYAKRFGGAYSDYFIGNFFGNAVLPSIWHEDPRYYQKGTGSAGSRALWAAESTGWCKRDNGKWGPNYANVIGNLIGAAIARVYYPASQRTVTDTITDGLTVSAEGIVGAEVIEFWPDIARHYKRKHAEKVALKAAQTDAAH